MKGKELEAKKRLDLKGLQGLITEAALEIQKNIGPGFSVENYRKALTREMQIRNVNFETDRKVQLPYKGEIAGQFVIDYLIDDRMIVSLYSTQEFIDSDLSRMKSFMKHLSLKIGMAIYFMGDKVEIKSIYQ